MTETQMFLVTLDHTGFEPSTTLDVLESLTKRDDTYPPEMVTVELLDSVPIQGELCEAVLTVTPTYDDLMNALWVIADDAEIGNRDAMKIVMALDEAGYWIVPKPEDEAS